MTLTADSGSTKTTWIVDGKTYRTMGINPFHMTEEQMRGVVNDELLKQEGFPATAEIECVRFYGAGCTPEKSPLLQKILQETFTVATSVEVDSDMLGAARALFGSAEGIACILGTGANSCLYDGKHITMGISPMGYILGDEGSGAVLGRTLLNTIYKGEHRDFIPVFEAETTLTLPQVIEKVYRQPMPSRFLASLAPFIKRHLDKEWMETMVVEAFRLFFKRNVSHYNRPDLPCSFVGGIAYHFEEQLRKAAAKEGVIIGEIKEEPLQ